MMFSPRFLWLVAVPGEGAAAWLLFFSNHPLAWIAALPLHVVASGVFGVSLLTRRDDQSWIWAWPLVGFTLALLMFPIMGMLAMALAFALAHTTFRQQTGPAAQGTADSEPDREDPIARAREIEVALLDELEIEPVVDVLRENDPELKRAAIEVITKQRGPGSVRLLIGLLHDPSPEARFFSSIGLSRLEDEISRSILSAQRAVAENPGAPAEQEHLAQLYVDYAISGFMEGVSREYYLDLAREAFEEALPTSANPDDVIYRLARVHLLLGNIGQAADFLDTLARRRPTDLDLHLLRMEVIYQFGDFRELVTYARRALPAVAGNVDQGELVEWWADVGPAEAAVAG